MLLCGFRAVKTAFFGPSSAARTHGLLVPNQARYQLRYTRIFNFCHYITAGRKIKDFSVCGHSCGQKRFYAIFGNRVKSRKHRRHKALRHFAMPYPGYRHGTLKPGAIPTSLYPDIHFSAMIPRRTVKIKIFLSVVIYVVKADFIPLSAIRGKPAIARAARHSGLLPKPRMDRVYPLPNHALYHLSYTRIFIFLFLPLWSKMWSNGDFRRFCGRDKVPKPQRFQGLRGFRISPSCRGCYTLPKQARYQLRYTRLLSYSIRLVVFSQIKRDTNFAIPGYFFSIPQLRVEGKRKFWVYINKVVIGGRLPADDDLIQICIKHLACCALRQREGDIRAEKVGVDGQVEAAALQLHQAPCDG